MFATICKGKKRKREGGEGIQGDAIVAFPSFSILGSHVGAGVCTLLEARTIEKNTKRRSSRQYRALPQPTLAPGFDDKT